MCDKKVIVEQDQSSDLVLSDPTEKKGALGAPVLGRDSNELKLAGIRVGNTLFSETSSFNHE